MEVQKVNLQKLMDFLNEHDEFSKNNGMQLTHLEAGHAVVEMEVRNKHTNFMGSAHGGALFTLADVAAGTAMIAHGHTCVTLNSTLSFIKPALSGKVRAVARELHSGSRIGVMEVSVEDESGSLLCTGTFTMYITGSMEGYLKSTT